MTQQINLFNPIFLRQKKYFSTVTILQALALVLVGTLCFYAYAVIQTNRLSREVAETGKRLDVEKARLTKISADFGPREKSKELEAQVKELEKRLKSSEDILGIQAGVASVQSRGFSGYLLAFARQSVNGLWITSITVGESGSKMTISGRALKAELVSDYIKRLSKEKAMHGITFSAMDLQQTAADSSLKSKAPEGYFEFNLRSVEPETK